MAKERRIRQADAVEWMGLCPCGCGTFKALLVDENGKYLATFGWDADGWANFMAGVALQIKGEPLDALVCGHHTAH